MKIIDPQSSKRAQAFQLWMNAPNPMVTFFKTFNVSPLIRYSKRKDYKFNMLLCWCIGKAASEIEEFYALPVGNDLVQYDQLAVNTIVKNKEGEVSSCDIPFDKNINKFNQDYLRFTKEVFETCENHDLTDNMVIGTSAITNTEIDGAVGMYSGIFNNPFLIWGKYKRQGLKKYITISFQFHHTQMDGAHAGKFFENLQREIMKIGKQRCV